MSQAPKFQARHYKEIARVLHGVYLKHDLTHPDIVSDVSRTVVFNVASKLADMFGRDNPRFKRGRFLDAVEEGTGL